MGRPVTDPVKRFHAFIRMENGCWVWAGEMSNSGYGRLLVKIAGRWRHITAHRFAYELAKGPIPDGLVIDHICRNKKCVNPEHLRAVTTQENILIGTSPSAVNAQKTHCPKGHEYTPDNIEPYRGRRRCRTCRRESCRERRAMRKWWQT